MLVKIIRTCMFVYKCYVYINLANIIICIQDEDEAAGVAGGGAEEVGSN